MGFCDRFKYSNDVKMHRDFLGIDVKLQAVIVRCRNFCNPENDAGERPLLEKL